MSRGTCSATQIVFTILKRYTRGPSGCARCCSEAVVLDHRVSRRLCCAAAPLDKDVDDGGNQADDHSTASHADGHDRQRERVAHPAQFQVARMLQDTRLQCAVVAFLEFIGAHKHDALLAARPLAQRGLARHGDGGALNTGDEARQCQVGIVGGVRVGPQGGQLAHFLGEYDARLSGGRGQEVVENSRARVRFIVVAVCVVAGGAGGEWGRSGRRYGGRRNARVRDGDGRRRRGSGRWGGHRGRRHYGSEGDRKGRPLPGGDAVCHLHETFSQALVHNALLVL
mmetsp:Transcript_8156/g.20544  ORF Transcript_8156/g.20544 Transcript_8156/m.20544 type:complete len:283 (-) Transcript_8156:367-1215(-)